LANKIREDPLFMIKKKKLNNVNVFWKIQFD